MPYSVFHLCYCNSLVRIFWNRLVWFGFEPERSVLAVLWVSDIAKLPRSVVLCLPCTVLHYHLPFIVAIFSATIVLLLPLYSEPYLEHVGPMQILCYFGAKSTTASNVLAGQSGLKLLCSLWILFLKVDVPLILSLSTQPQIFVNLWILAFFEASILESNLTVISWGAQNLVGYWMDGIAVLLLKETKTRKIWSSHVIYSISWMKMIMIYTSCTWLLIYSFPFNVCQCT